jgi:site-specific DNA recombinase
VKEPKTRAAIALRYSSDRQHERSLEDQERNCRREIESRGWSVAEDWVCRDAAKSGASVAGREGFHRLLQGARSPAHPFDAVVVDDLSRLTREADVTLTVFKELQHHGIQLVGVSDGFDSKRRGAKLEAGLRGLMNEAYLDDLAEKTRRGLEGQFLRGFHAGGHLFGYRSEPVLEEGGRVGAHGEREVIGYRIRPEEGEAAVVHRLFELYTRQRMSVNAIVRKLNEEGVPWPGANIGFARKRRGWAHSAVVALLDSEKYAGRWVWNRRRWFKDPTSGKRRYVERPESEWTRNEVPELALIDAETWNAAQRLRAEQRAKFPHFGSSVKAGVVARGAVRHLLSGLLVCGECNGSISIVGGQKKQTAQGFVDYRTYGCTNHFRKGREFCPNAKTISLRKLERSIIGGLQREVLHPEMIERFIRRFRARVAESVRAREPEKHLARVEREAAKLKAELSRLVDLFAAGGGSVSAVQDALSQRRGRLAELDGEAAELRRLPTENDLLPNDSAMKAYLDDLSGTLTSGRERARALLERRVGKITLVLKHCGPRTTYVASGRFDFGRFDESHKQQGVAGTGFEPVTFGL